MASSVPDPRRAAIVLDAIDRRIAEFGVTPRVSGGDMIRMRSVAAELVESYEKFVEEHAVLLSYYLKHRGDR